MSEQDFEQEIRFMIDEAQKERDKLNRRLQNAQEGLLAIEAKLTAYRETLRDYCQLHDIPFQENVPDEALRVEFAELSTKDALVKIARMGGGVIVARDACRLLVQAGMFRDTRNASGNVYSTFQRFPRVFKKIDKGTYRLVEQPSAERIGSVTPPANADVQGPTMPDGSPGYPAGVVNLESRGLGGSHE